MKFEELQKLCDNENFTLTKHDDVYLIRITRKRWNRESKHVGQWSTYVRLTEEVVANMNYQALYNYIYQELEVAIEHEYAKEHIEHHHEIMKIVNG